MTKEKAIEICNAHEKAMEETPRKVVDMIYSQFPCGLSINQITVLLDEVKELMNAKPLVPWKEK